MKRTIRTIFCAAAVVMAAVSCQKSAEPVQPAEEGKGTIDICVNGLMGEYTQVDGTKAELVNTVRVSWKGGETVYVYDETKCLGSLKASLEGDEDRYAVLSTDGSTHKVSTPADGTTTLTLVYSPLLTEAPAVSNDAISISISLASQSGEKTPFVAFATLDYTGTTIKNAVVPFQFATSVIKVNCTGLKANTAIDKATLSNVNTECKLTLSGTAAPSVSGDINGTITRTGDAYFAADKVNEEGEAVFQIAVPALEAASEARVLAVKQGSSKVKDKNFSMKKIAAATSVNTVCQLSSIPIPDGALPGLFTVDSNGKQVLFSKGNLYCSGVEFYTDEAADNYGTVKSMANAQWGFEANQYDTTPSSDDNRVENHISHFMWCADATNAMALKYKDGEDGWGKDETFFAGKNFTVNGYSGWHTLSTKEWQYLFNTRTVNGGQGAGKSYSLNITYGGKMGVVLYPDDYSGSTLTSDTDYTDANFPANCVFLPAAGYRDGSPHSQNDPAYVSNVGYSGNYLSSTAKSWVTAYGVAFSSPIVYPDGSGSRNGGISVRLVTESK